MAPEVWMDQHTAPSTDVSALAVIFFEAVTGRPPFEAPDTHKLREMHLYTPVPRPKTINPSTPELIDGVIRKLLSKAMRDRYQTAQEVLSVLESVIPAPDSAIAVLADRVRTHHDAAEAKELEHEKLIRQEQDSQARIKYMEQQLLELIQEVMDELNAQLVETKIARRDGYGGRVYEFQGRQLVIEFFRPGEIYHDPEVPGLMDTLRKQNVVHGGTIKIRDHGEDHESWNIVLVRPASDLYGEWRLVESRVSPLTGRRTRYEPIATNTQLFATNLGYHWMHTMHTFQLNDKPLEKADIVKIIGIFIPK
jgi:serine/threonine protein kinase